MFPVIVNFGPFTISSLGVFMSLAFFFGSFKIWRKAREEHLEDEDIFDIIFLSFFGGLIFARLFFVFLNFETFGLRISRWLDLAANNGFSWIGFLIGAMIMGAIVTKKKKVDFWMMSDISVYGVIWANILILIGLFLDCSAYGRVSNLPWAIKLPGVEGARHPLPFYEIALLLIIIYFERWLDKRYRLFKWYQNKRGKANPGFLWLFYLSIFVVSQFLLSLVMESQPVLGPLTSYQILLMFSMFVVGFAFWLRAGNEIKLIDDGEKRPQTMMAKSNISPRVRGTGDLKTNKTDKKEELKVIRPVSKTPVRELKKRERPAPKRFKRGKRGLDYR